MDQIRRFPTRLILPAALRRGNHLTFSLESLQNRRTADIESLRLYCTDAERD